MDFVSLAEGVAAALLAGAGAGAAGFGGELALRFAADSLRCRAGSTLLAGVASAIATLSGSHSISS